MTRWGFLGTGRVTQRMADAIRSAPPAQLMAVASRDLSRSQAWADHQHELHAVSRANRIRAFGSYAELVDDPAIDWVYIALPPSLHREWAERCMRSGKNVVCEKPLGISWSEASQLEELSRRTGCLLIDATGYPFHPRSLAARRLLHSDEFGSLRRVTMACSFTELQQRPDDHRWNPALGGGCLLDLGWYCVHATLWLTGLRCRSVRALGEQRHGVWYHVQVLAEFDEGVMAHWDCGFDAAGRKWIEIAGSHASWICDDLIRPWNSSLPRFWVHASAGKARAESHGTDHFQEATLIACCTQATVAASQGIPSPGSNSKQEFQQSLSLAVATQRILEAIDRSATLRTQVDLDEDA